MQPGTKPTFVPSCGKGKCAGNRIPISRNWSCSWNQLAGPSNVKAFGSRDEPPSTAVEGVRASVWRFSVDPVYNYQVRRYVTVPVGVSLLGRKPTLLLRQKTECSLEPSRISRYPNFTPALLRKWVLFFVIFVLRVFIRATSHTTRNLRIPRPSSGVLSWGGGRARNNG